MRASGGRGGGQSTLIPPPPHTHRLHWHTHSPSDAPPPALSPFHGLCFAEVCVCVRGQGGGAAAFLGPAIKRPTPRATATGGLGGRQRVPLDPRAGLGTAEGPVLCGCSCVARHGPMVKDNPGARQPPTAATYRQPPTATRQLLSTATNRQPPPANCCQLPPTANCHPPTAANCHQPPIANRQPRP